MSMVNVLHKLMGEDKKAKPVEQPKDPETDTKVELARMAYQLLHVYEWDARNHTLEGSILDIRSQALFIDNKSYSLGEESMGFGIDLLVREHGTTVFQARGPWPTPREFAVYVPGKWEERIRSLYEECVEE